MKELLARLKSRPAIFSEMIAASLLANILALATPLFVIQVLNRGADHLAVLLHLVEDHQLGLHRGAELAVNLSRRLTPSLGHLLHNLGWKSLEPFGVLADGDMTDRHFKLLFGKRVPVVAAPFDDAVDQFISGFGYIGDVITGAFHGIQNADHRRRCIQTHRVADTGVLGG